MRYGIIVTMSMLCQNMQNVAIIMLMVILLMPAAVHAHTLELLGAETSHATGGGCHDADNKTDHNAPDNHPNDVRCCELDTPYVQLSITINTKAPAQAEQELLYCIRNVFNGLQQ